jgi:hypothetical protein
MLTRDGEVVIWSGNSGGVGSLHRVHRDRPSLFVRMSAVYRARAIAMQSHWQGIHISSSMFLSAVHASTSPPLYTVTHVLHRTPKL